MSGWVEIAGPQLLTQILWDPQWIPGTVGVRAWFPFFR